MYIETGDPLIHKDSFMETAKKAELWHFLNILNIQDDGSEWTVQLLTS